MSLLRESGPIPEGQAIADAATSGRADDGGYPSYFLADSATKLPAEKMARTTRISALTISEKEIATNLTTQRISTPCRSQPASMPGADDAIATGSRKCLVLVIGSAGGNLGAVSHHGEVLNLIPWLTSCAPETDSASANAYIVISHSPLGVLSPWQQSVFAREVWFLTDAPSTTNRKQSPLRGSLAPERGPFSFESWRSRLAQYAASHCCGLAFSAHGPDLFECAWFCMA